MKVKPYKGDGNFIFFSYSHRDMREALEVVEQLQAHGYNVWFDEGIDPGTEWDEMIARHIEKCSYFIGYITENYIDSQNCRDEINYARDLNKDRLLIYGEDVELPGGMKMRMNRLQAIYRHRYSRPEDFYEKVFNAYGINTCRSGTVGSGAPEDKRPEAAVPLADKHDELNEFVIDHGPKVIVTAPPSPAPVAGVPQNAEMPHTKVQPSGNSGGLSKKTIIIMVVAIIAFAFCMAISSTIGSDTSDSVEETEDYSDYYEISAEGITVKLPYGWYESNQGPRMYYSEDVKMAIEIVKVGADDEDEDLPKALYETGAKTVRDNVVDILSGKDFVRDLTKGEIIVNEEKFYWLRYCDTKAAENTTGEPVVVTAYYFPVEKKQQLTRVDFYYFNYDGNDNGADYDAERDKIIKSITID